MLHHDGKDAVPPLSSRRAIREGRNSMRVEGSVVSGKCQHHDSAMLAFKNHSFKDSPVRST
jgi:hypothetical protein